MNRKEQVLALCEKVQRDLKLAGLVGDGAASDGTLYSNIAEMWSAQLGLGRPGAPPPIGTRGNKEEGEEEAADGTEIDDVDATLKQSPPPAPHAAPAAGAGSAQWYERAYDYWEDGENCGLDDDGVLGGYGHISPTDISGSASFLDYIKSMRPLLGDEKAADCGAGIGRITKHLLLDRFDSVDIVEQSPRLLRAAPKYVGQERDRTECLCIGLQDFFPAEDKYDLFWIQWVVGHFTDVDLIKLMNRCRGALKKGGLVVIKDNVVPVGGEEGAFIVDCEDSSMTRSLGYFRSLFNHGGIKVVHQQRQEGFPGEIFPVYMFALE